MKKLIPFLYIALGANTIQAMENPYQVAPRIEIINGKLSLIPTFSSAITAKNPFCILPFTESPAIASNQLTTLTNPFSVVIPAFTKAKFVPKQSSSDSFDAYSIDLNADSDVDTDTEKKLHKIEMQKYIHHFKANTKIPKEAAPAALMKARMLGNQLNFRIDKSSKRATIQACKKLPTNQDAIRALLQKSKTSVPLQESEDCILSEDRSPFPNDTYSPFRTFTFKRKKLTN